jgi:hypothetical protein
MGGDFGLVWLAMLVVFLIIVGSVLLAHAVLSWLLD